MTEQEQKLLTWLNARATGLRCRVCNKILNAVTTAKHCAGMVLFCSDAFTLTDDNNGQELKQFTRGSLEAAGWHYDQSCVLFLADDCFQSYADQLKDAMTEQRKWQSLGE